MSETARSTHTTQAADPPEVPPSVAAKPNHRSWLRVLFRLLLQAALLLLLVVFWMLGTQSGLRLVLSLAEELVPALLQVERADGCILGDLHLKGLIIRVPGVALRFSNLELHWSPLTTLTTGTLQVSALSTRELDVAIAPSEDEAEAASGPVELPEIRLPLGLALELEQAWIGQLGIGTLDEDTRFRIDRIGLVARWSGSRVDLKALTLTLPEPRLRASAQGEVALTGAYPLALGLTWELAQAPAVALAGTATIGGDLEALQVEHDLTGSARAKVWALVQGILDHPRWAGEVRIRGVDLPAIRADLPALDLSGILTTSGDVDDVQVQGNLTGMVPGLPDLGQLRAGLDIRWRDQVLRISVLGLTSDQSGALFTVGGELDFSDPASKVDLRAAWKGLCWPLVGEPIAESGQGTLQARGTFDEFSYRISSEVSGRDFPAAKLRLTGKGNREAAQIEDLQIDTLGGHLRATADVTWAPVVTWDMELRVVDMNPGRQWPKWGGVLNGRILSKGALKDGGPELSAQVASLTGQLRGYPVDAVAGIRMQGTEVRIDKLRVTSGPSRLTAGGSVGERLDLTVNIGSPDLKSLLPDVQGSIQADGAITGTLAAPAARLELTVASVAVAGQRIQNLSGTAQVDLAPGGPVKIDLAGQDLAAGGMVFDNLRIQGWGDMGSHRLSAQLAGTPLSLNLKAAGGLKGENAYAGRLEELALRTREFGTWRLQKAAPIALAGARISAGPLCIREEVGEKTGSGGCVRFAQQEAGRWNAALDLDQLAFDLFKGFLPRDLILTGEARAKADFQAAGEILTGNARIQVVKGVLDTLHGRDGAHPEILSFTSAQLAIDAGKSGLQARLRVPLTGLGELSAAASLPDWSLKEPARPQQSLRGDLKARIKDLGIVSRLVPDITQVTGNLNADVKFGGTFAEPGFSGSVRLAGGGLEVPFIGLRIEDLTFDAQARELERIDYSGGFRAGKGRLAIKGHSLSGGAAGPSTRIDFKGSKLKVADSKEYFVLAAPDIRAEIGPTGARITGRVTVPEARIQPRHIPAGTVSPSPNVVSVSEVQEKGSRYPTSIDLRLVLGEQVAVDALGLKGRLQGKLAVLQAPGGELLGDGRLEIIDGTYRISAIEPLNAAVGTLLIIEQGVLSYAKSPIDNPHLILTAQRKGGDITAGLRVFGTIRNPKLTFFSMTDPGMSQSEVTKYLLTGIPPKRGDKQQAHNVSLSTYIAPKLFTEYDYNLGNEPDKIKLRYDLSNRVELQAETGETQGGDILFTIEH